LQLRKNLENKDILELEDELTFHAKCPFCNSFNIIKHGTRKNKNGVKQRYLCKDCNRTFVLDPVKGHKANGKLIALSMDLYFKGLSFRKIVRNVGIRKERNNNIIERYHGTVRERDKVIRALDNIDTAKEMMEYWRICYNYIRPHSALNGFTPAQMARIGVGYKRNRWMGLLRKSMEK